MGKIPSVLLPVSALAFMSWVVYFGGLAALQSSCGDWDYPRPTGLASVPCSAIYRLPWFYFVIEFIIIITTLGASISGNMQQWREILLCSYGVAFFLFISVADKMINVDFYMQHYRSFQHSPYGYAHIDNGFPRPRIQATTAGAIMVSIANALAVLVLSQFSDAALIQEGLKVAKALPPQVTQPFPDCPLCLLCQGACYVYTEVVDMVSQPSTDGYKAPGQDMVAMRASEQPPLIFTSPSHQQSTAVGLDSVAQSHQQSDGVALILPAQAQYNPFIKNDPPI